MANRNRRSQHVFNPREMKELDLIQLPTRLKCTECNKLKSLQNFSHRMLCEARYAAKNRSPWVVRCIPCSGAGQLVELECVMCHETKAIDEFAKAQRRKPDSAKCFDCIDKQLDLNPIEEDMYEDSRETFIDDADSLGKYPTYWPASTATDSSVSSDFGDNDSDNDRSGGISLIKGFGGISMGSSRTGTLIDTEEAFPPQENENADSSGWKTVGSAKTKSWQTPSTKSSEFDPNKYGNPSGRSSALASGSEYSFASGKADQSDEVSSKGGWAKIKAFKTESTARAAGKLPRPQIDDDWKSDSEGEADNDESSDDDTEI